MNDRSRERGPCMKRIASVVSSVLLCLAVVSPARSQEAVTVNVTGKWELSSETPRGPMTSTVTFAQEGNALTGTVETPRGSTPIASGSVEGNRITFTVVRSMGERSVETTYTGTVEGGTISGTMSNPRGGEVPWTAKKVTEP